MKISRASDLLPLYGIFACIALLTPSLGHAQVLLQYNWSGSTGDTPTSTSGPVTFSNPSVNGSAMGLGPFTGNTGGAGSAYGFSTSTYTSFARTEAFSQFTGSGPYTYNMSEADSIAQGDYFQFTLTPTVGNTISLSSFSGTVGGAMGVASNSFEATFYIQASTNNFATYTDLGNESVTVNGITWGNAGTQAALSLDLSGFSALQGLTSSTTVTFRIYEAISTNATGSSTDGLNQLLRFNDISVSAVPEPTTWALIGFGLAFLTLLGTRSKSGFRQIC